MKTSSLTALVVSATNVATAVRFISGPGDWIKGVGFNTSRPEDHGTLFDPPKIAARDAFALPLQVELKNRNPHVPGSKSVKVRYGPFTVPGGKVYVESPNT
jgi:hypothetical protein